MMGMTIYAAQQAKKKQEEEAAIVKHDLVFCNACGCFILLDAEGKTANCSHTKEKWERKKIV